MWFFMISCYILSALSFLLITMLFILEFGSINFLNLPPLVFLLGTAIAYLFTETLIIFFFVGTGVCVRDYTKLQGLPNTFHKRSLAIKFRIYPVTMFNLMMMIALFIMPGAVHTHALAKWIYEIFFIACLAHFLYTFKIQHECFRDNTDIILEMSGVKQPNSA